jgi:hypothetical protein
MDTSGAPKRFTKARAIYVILLSIFLVVGVFVTRNPSVVKGPMSATEYCKLLYDAPGKIWEAQLPPKIKKIAKEIETNEKTYVAKEHLDMKNVLTELGFYDLKKS